jgi:BlaI family penicillinase repressor
MTPSNKELPQLAPAELDVMKVLWADGRLSAREVHERLAERQGWAYSTTRTTLERLVKKAVLGKDAFHGLHLYEPRITRAAGLARMVRDFARQVLETSPVPVVSLFAESGTLTADEIAELDALLKTTETAP